MSKGAKTFGPCSRTASWAGQTRHPSLHHGSRHWPIFRMSHCPALFLHVAGPSATRAVLVISWLKRRQIRRTTRRSMQLLLKIKSLLSLHLWAACMNDGPRILNYAREVRMRSVSEQTDILFQIKPKLLYRSWKQRHERANEPTTIANWSLIMWVQIESRFVVLAGKARPPLITSHNLTSSSVTTTFTGPFALTSGLD